MALPLHRAPSYLPERGFQTSLSALDQNLCLSEINTQLLREDLSSGTWTMVTDGGPGTMPLGHTS